MSLHRVIKCLAFAIVLSLFQPASALEPAGPMGVYVHRLENGLTVYLTEHHESPRFYAEIVVRAGSKHDPAEATGLAHYLEHLLFKGTQSFGTTDFEREKPHLERIADLYEERFHETDPKKRKAIYAAINTASQDAAKYAIPNELDQIFEALGGKHLNAHTWHEETVYKISLPSNSLERWAAIESERFAHPVIRLFQPELEVVYEEKNRSMDNKQRVITQAIENLLYKSHPYGQQPTIGTTEHLKNPSIRQIEKYYKKHYVPGNMALILSGDFKKEEAVQIIEKYFSRWEAKPVPTAQTWEEAPLLGAERVTVQFPAEDFVIMAFRTGSRNEADADALRIIDMILDNSVAGLINLNLNETQRVRQAGSYPSLNNDYGAQYLWGIPKKDQTLEEVEHLLLAQIKRIKRGDFEDWILPAIVTDYKKYQMQNEETNRGRVNLLRDSFVAGKTWEHTAGQIERMEAFTKDDIVRTANRYFGDDYVVGHRKGGEHEVPTIEKPVFDPIDIDPSKRSPFMKNILEMKSPGIEPSFIRPGVDYHTIESTPGRMIYHAANRINTLFSLTLSIEIGPRQNPHIGLAGLLLGKSGNALFEPQDLKKEWYKLGTDFRFEPHYNRVDLKLTGVDENLEASLALLMSSLNTPKTHPRTLAELVEIALLRRKDNAKEPKVLSHALREFARYGQDSIYRIRLPESEARKLTTDGLLELIRSLPHYAHSLEYVGPRSPEELLAVIERTYPIEGDLKPTPPFVPRKMQAPESTVVYLFDKAAAQARIFLDFPDGDYSENHYPIMEIYNDYFSGNMNSVVFQELREARALAYTVRARYGTGNRKGEENTMGGFIATQADKTPGAVEVFIDLLDNLPLDEARFNGTRDAVNVRYQTTKTAYRRILEYVRAWERLGIPVDPRPRRHSVSKNLQIDDLSGFHAEHIKGREKVISIVGDKSKMDLERLRKIGTIREMNLEDLFVF